MDLIAGSIIGATIVAAANLTIFQMNRIKDEKKERLKNLYNPMYSLIERRRKYLSFLKPYGKEDDAAFEMFAVEYYHYFLELRDIYYDNKIYESKELRFAFHTLLHNHEREIKNFRRFKNLTTEEELITNVALFELNHLVDEDVMSEFERNLDKVIEVINNDIRKMSRAI